MKKIIAMTLALCLTLALVACGDKGDSGKVDYHNVKHYRRRKRWLA